jgi:putative 4-mercaptohistidine N1-methyltranferase
MTDYYETDEQVGQYLAFHFGPDHFGVPNYPRACAQRCLAVTQGAPRRRALDLGCAVGRSTFELAHGFDEVVGVDLSRRFIQTAEALRQTGGVDCTLVEEGELTRSASVELSVLGLGDTRGRVRFEQGDAGALGEHHGSYDLVFAGNLIDRMADPAAFLESLHHRLNPGGYLVISSPYTLLEAFTPRENWLGGFRDESGEPVTVLAGMRRCLAPHFRLLGEPEELPFVIRETRRKFQHTLAQLTLWQRLPQES